VLAIDDGNARNQLWLNLMTGVVMVGHDALTNGRLGRLHDRAERTYGLRFSAQTLNERAPPRVGSPGPRPDTR
jgi:hypothetical protein